MRKIYSITRNILLLLFLQFFVNEDVYAQSDAFFTDTRDKRFEYFDDAQAPSLPYSHGLSDNYSTVDPVPIGGVMRFLYYYQ